MNKQTLIKKVEKVYNNILKNSWKNEWRDSDFGTLKNLKMHFKLIGMYK